MPDVVLLSDSTLDVAALRAAASDPRCGAVVVFEGCTRDHHEGRPVQRLAFEAFIPMATSALDTLRQEAMARFGLATCFIHHRLGEVPMGDTAVAVVLASPHRQEAFQAVNWIMERLKADVPIWKREVYTDGGAAWVEGETRTGGDV